MPVSSPLRRRCRRLATVAVLALALSGPSVIAHAESAEDSPGPSTTVPGYDLENDPSQCIGFLPRPNCGREPTDAGDRGGWLQYAVFGVLMSGLAVIGGVIAVSVRRRDRAVASGARPPG